MFKEEKKSGKNFYHADFHTQSNEQHHAVVSS